MWTAPFWQGYHLQYELVGTAICSAGVVTLSAISLISAIEQQAKSLKFHASAFADIGEFRSI
jgi:hypothetical protein